MAEADGIAEAKRRIAVAIAEGAARIDLSDLIGLESLAPLAEDLTRAVSVTLLDLSSTPISDLQPIAKMAGIVWLDLRNTNVSDISPLKGMKRVERLDLSDTQIMDISPVAQLTGIKRLDLNDTKISDITPLKNLTGIIWLGLRNTQVTDLWPVAGLNKIERLKLERSSVVDLRPIRGLTKLKEISRGFGLTFGGTAASRQDARIAEISIVSNHADRARQLFDYLEDWVPPINAGGPLAPDETVRVFFRSGRIGVDTISPDAMDALKETLHERLKNSASQLSKAAGNQFPRLCEVSRSVLAEAEKPFDQVSLLNLFLDNEALKEWQDAGAEDGIDFPPEVAVPLSDVTRTVPGIALGDEAIDTLVERLNRDRGVTPPEDVQRAQQDMSDVLSADEDAVDTSLRDLNARIDRLSSDVSFLVRKTTNKNVFLIVAGTVGVGVYGVGQSIVASAIDEPVIAMFQAHWKVFVAAAESHSLQLAHYLASSFADVPAVAKLAKQTLEDIRGRLKN